MKPAECRVQSAAVAASLGCSETPYDRDTILQAASNVGYEPEGRLQPRIQDRIPPTASSIPEDIHGAPERVSGAKGVLLSYR